jgi:hypothetical protein
MRQQCELTFFIGYPGSPCDAFETACVEAATSLCGGCFVADGTGFWRSGADRRAARFHGQLQAERTLCLRLTTELAKEADVLEAMRNAIAAAVESHGLRDSIRWIHVQRHQIVGLHFSIDDVPAQAA